MRYVETGIFDAVITHNRYTLINRSAEPLLDLASKRGLAVLNAAPYGSGILAKGVESYPRYAYQEANPTVRERVHQLHDICAAHHVPLAAAALQFSTRDARITATIVGMSRAERIQQTVDLLRHPIPEAVWTELLAIPAEMDDPEIGRFKRVEE
jgi:D-threo-aldose 1-dehydrogenase